MSWIDEDTEAAHLAEIEDEDIDAWSEDDENPGLWYEDDNAQERRENSRRRFESKRQKGVDDNEKHYLKNKEAKVGTQITCAGPLCNKHFKRCNMLRRSVATNVRISSGTDAKRIMATENQFNYERI